jgi:hypothetical protein
MHPRVAGIESVVLLAAVAGDELVFDVEILAAVDVV